MVGQDVMGLPFSSMKRSSWSRNFFRSGLSSNSKRRASESLIVDTVFGLDGAARGGILAQLAPGQGLWTSLYSSCCELIDAAPGLGTVLCGVGG